MDDLSLALEDSGSSLTALEAFLVRVRALHAFAPQPVQLKSVSRRPTFSRLPCRRRRRQSRSSEDIQVAGNRRLGCMRMCLNRIRSLSAKPSMDVDEPFNNIPPRMYSRHPDNR